MKPIHGKISSFTSESDELKEQQVEEIRLSNGHPIATYSELISKLAKLAFANPEMVLLMRGQTQDYKDRSHKTTLFPTIYRFRQGRSAFYAHDLQASYETLAKCERKLCQVLHGSVYWDRVGRSELARWAILQHYEVCPTPLLDVTHSALVACSFAFLNPKKNDGKYFFLYVLGVPQINGSITVSPNRALQVVRLSGVCPPETLRPYFQEGYLIGNYPSVDTLDEKMRYERSEMDCSQRLVAKFRITRSDLFWDSGFKGLSESSLYPEEKGALCKKLADLKNL
jgi:hypothetical protein